MIRRVLSQGVHVFLFVTLFASCGFATDRLVPSAYPTLQNALSAAVSGDTIIISPGTYFGSGNSNLNISSKIITIRSTNPADPNIVASTVIDGFDSSAGNCPVFNGVLSKSTLVIEGITILNCYDNTGGAIEVMDSNLILRNCVFEDCFVWENGGVIRAYHSNIKMQGCVVIGGFAQGRGGAIYAENKSSVELSDCNFTDNWSMSSGGALYIYDSNLSSITGCIFTGNTALGAASGLRGGAIYIERPILKNDNLLINGSNFTDNFASGEGGGVYARNQSLAISHSNFIANISQQYGGGISYDCNMTLVNSVLAGNVSYMYGAAVDSPNRTPKNNTVIRNCTFADALYSRSGGYFIRTGGNNISITNSIFWGTSGISCYFNYYQNLIFAYNNVQGGRLPVGTGVHDNIQVDPTFVQPGGWNNGTYVAGDYHIALESPMINAGDPNTIIESGETDIDGNPRIRLGRIDIGAYEQGTHKMDFNEDGAVNFIDFAQFAEAWLWHRMGLN